MIEVTALIRGDDNGADSFDELFPRGVVEHVNMELGPNESVARGRAQDPKSGVDKSVQIRKKV